MLGWRFTPHLHRPHRSEVERPRVEALEARILYAADLASVALPGLSPSAEVRQLDTRLSDTTAAGEQLVRRLDIVVVDTRVPDYQRMLQDLRNSQDTGRDMQVVVIGADEDGVDVLSRALGEAPREVAAVHLISHGGPGQLQLGSATLDKLSIEARQDQLRSWSLSLSDEADLLIYGCDLTANAEGIALIGRLAQLTGADVAASDDATGASALGGDWVLEASTGSIETGLALSLELQQSWEGVLAITSNGTVTSAQTTGATSLTWAHTVAAGTNRALFVELAIDGLGASTTSVKYGAASLTLVGRATGNHAAEIWVLVNPAVGTANIVATFAATTGAAGGATTFNGVSQSAPTGTFASATGTGTVASVDVASAAGDLVIDVQYWLGIPSGGAVGANQTIQWTQQNAVLTGGSTTEPGVAGTVTMSGSFSSSAQWEIGAVAIKSAAGITVTPTSGLTTTEAGGTAQFSVVLDKAPTANVTIGLSSSDTTEGTLSASSLVFTTANWSTPQTVTVTGADDSFVDGTVAYSIVTTAATSADAQYNGLNASDVSLSNTDNDTFNTLHVDTTNDTLDGTTTSIAALMANKGADGRISLREAITAANNTANGIGGADRVHFNITGTGTHTILLGGALPLITGAVVLDASTDDSFAVNLNRPAIILDGNDLAADGLVLTATADGSTIRGLVIRNFNGDGVQIDAGSDGNLIAGNYIGGLSTTGVAFAGAGNTGAGVSVLGANNQIGGTDGLDRNLLSGNGNGVVIQGLSATGNQVSGNTIGTTATGLVAVANTFDGVRIEAGATGNTIGGLTAAHRNVIAANGGDGVQIDGEATDGNFVRNNWIGIGADGSTPLGNGSDGIFISGGSDSNVIGGVGMGNVIGFSALVGIEIDDASLVSSENIIQGNFVGTDATGSLNFGNGQNGILLERNATNNSIGGTAAGEGNIVAFNGTGGVWTDGIFISASTSTGNSVLGNRIFGNAGVGINLGPSANTVLPNDSGDADAGSNGLQNYPVLTGARTNGSNTLLVTGLLNSSAASHYRIEFFASASADGSGHGEGATYLGSADVVTDASGNVSFSASLAASVAAGQSISATATRSNATYTSFSDTSEFSRNVTVAATAPPVLLVTGAGSIVAGATYTLNLSATDPDGVSITSWTVNWGDGSIITYAGNPSSVTHTYAAALQGLTMNISASATDADGTHFGNDLLIPEYGGSHEVQRYNGSNKVFIGSFADSDGMLDQAQVITGPDGQLYVSGFSSGNVLRYTAGGAFVDTFVAAGSGGLGWAAGLAFGHDGNLYVASSSTSSVLRFDGTTGAYMDDFVASGSGSVGFPLGLVFGPDGHLYVADGNQVARFDGVTGASMGAFVAPGSGGLATAEHLAFGPTGDLFVADFSAGSVRQYNGSTGAFVGNFVTGLIGPAGVAFGPDGHLYLSDELNGTVSRYDSSTGAFIDHYVSSSANGLEGPAYLSFAPSVQVAVLPDPTPTISGLAGDALAYAEGDGALVIEQGGDVLVVDQDSADFDGGSLTVSLVNGSTAAEDLLGVRHQGSGSGQIGLTGSSVAYQGVAIGAVSGGANGSALVIGFNSQATPDAVAALLQNITYRNTNLTSPTQDLRTVRFVLADGDGQTSTASDATVAVSAVDDAPSFSRGDGKLTTTFATSADIKSVVVQPDGKIVVAGYAGSAMVLARYNPDGTLDSTFGTAGKVSTIVGSSSEAWSVALQPDGRILVAGASFNGSNYDFALVRYNADGSLDTGFGTNGTRTTAIGSGDDRGVSVAVQRDGRIVVAGTSHNGTNQDFALVRYNADGSLDTSFSGDGKFSTAIGAGDDIVTAMALQSDGRIIVGGYSANGTDNDFALLRVNTDGSLDTSFSGDGKLTTAIGTGLDQLEGLALQADGRIVAVGTSQGASSDIALVRYNQDGSLDTSFDTDGKLVTVFSAAEDFGSSVVIQPDGKIVVAGRTLVSGNADYALVRYLTDGTLDTSFDTDGKLTTDFAGSGDLARTLAIQSDGKLVVAGMTWTGAGFSAGVTRYNTNGSLDTGFDSAFTNTLDGAPAFTEGGSAVVLDGNVGIFDAELSALDNFNGTTLTLARATAASAQDVYSATGALSALTEGGNLVLSGTTIGTVTTNSGGTLVLSFNTNASNARVNTAMQLIAYRNTSDAPSASVQINWTFSDGNTGAQGTGGALTATGGTTVSITAVNDAPTVTNLSGDSLAYSEGDGAVVIEQGGNALVADVDSADFATGTLTVSFTAGSNSAEDVLGIRNQGTSAGQIGVSGANVSYEGVTIGSFTGGSAGANLVITLNASATPTAVTALVQSITYQNTDTNAPTAGARTVRFVLTDGDGGTSASHDTTVAVSGVNDAPTFNIGDGKLSTAIGSGNDLGVASALQADGKILVAGYSFNGSDNDFALVRYNSDGTLDSSFSGDGKLTTAIGTGNDLGRSVTVQADGKILVAGYGFNASNSDFALVRYNSDGSLDTSFSGDGMLTTDIGAGSDVGDSVTVQADGKILVAGSSIVGSFYDFALVRYNSDGSLDTSFSGDGKLTTGIGASEDFGDSVTVQADGKILVAGTSYNGSNYDFGLARYNSDGTPDTSFSSDGKLTTAIGANDDNGYSVTVQTDGRILLAGYSFNGSFNDFALVRYNTDGSLDSSFSGDGKLTTAVGSGNAYSYSVTAQTDGKILVAGYGFNASNSDFALVRYNSDGTLDTSFSSDGQLTTDIAGSNDRGQSVNVQADGKIVVAGYGSNGSDNDFALVRYNSDGTLDTRFDSTFTNTLGGSVVFTEGGTAVVLDADVQVLDTELSTTDNFDGATLTLARNGGANAQDLYSATGTLSSISAASGNVMVGGTTIGTYIQVGGALVFSFNASATNALVNSAMRQIAYSNTGNAPPASVQIDWLFDDGNTGAQGTGGALQATGSTVVSITAVNSAPVLDNTGTMSLLPVGENDSNPAPQTVASIIASAGGNRITDADGAVLEGIAITGINGYPFTFSSGLQYSVDGGTSWQSVGRVSSAQSLLLRDTDLLRYVYAPTNYSTPTLNFTFRAWDQTSGSAGSRVDSSVNGGNTAFSTATEQVSASVIAQNDAPLFGYGQTGVITPHFSGDINGYEAGQAVVGLPDGRVLMVGETTDAATSQYRLVLAQYLADGRPDTSFGEGGAVITALGGTDARGSEALRLAAGRWLVSGQRDGNPFVARFLADGTLDASFGTAGISSLAVATFFEGWRDMAVDSADRIVLLHHVAGNATVTRLLADGSLDTSFGSGGTAVFGSGAASEAISLAVQADDKIVVAGESASGGFVQRFNANGTDDASFGGTGTVTLTMGGATNTRAHSVAVQPDGAIVVGGLGSYAGGSGMTITRLLANGALDTSFAGGGTQVAFVGVAGSVNWVPEIYVEADGKIATGGQISYDGWRTTAMMRVNADGSLDNSFGSGGATLQPLGPWSDYIFAMGVSADGGYLFTGELYPGHFNDASPAIIQLTPTGALASSLTVQTLDNAPVFLSGGAPVVLDSSVVVYDAELEAANNYAGATLTLVRAGGANADDVFSASGNLGALTEGAALVIRGTTIGTVTTNSAGTLVLTFDASARTQRVNDTLSSIAYANSNLAAPASVQIDWTFSDGNTGAQGSGGALQATGSTVVSITAVNDVPRFGIGERDGMVTTAVGASDDWGRSITVQADGKILVAGSSHNGSNDFAVARYNADGSLDTSFGSGGTLTTDIGPGDDDGYSIALQADGKILVAGSSHNGSDLDFAVVRYNTDGSLDTSFGSGGQLTTAIGSSDDHGYGIAVQPDGKILVAGSSADVSGERFAVVRYNADGSLDAGFGSGGQVTTAIDGGGRSVTVQPDGKILVSGNSWLGGNGDFAVVRYNADGSLDTSFGSGGTLATDIGSGSDDGAYSITVQSDGKIVVAGESNNNGNDYDFAVVRYNTDGSLDTSFGSGGKLTTAVGSGSDDYGYSIALQPDGKIVVAGASAGGSDEHFAAVRYNADGTLDAGFGSGGKVITANASGGWATTLQPDGKILVAGYSWIGGNSDFAVVRYNADGSLDTSFDVVGGLNGAPTYTEGGAPVVLDADVQVFDAELSAADNFDGATLTLGRNGGANAEDVFSATGTLGSISAASGSLVVGGTTIGTYTQGAGVLTFTFHSSATNALANTAMQQVAYANGSDAPPASVQIDWLFDDGNAGSQGSGPALAAVGGTTVNIAAVNDAPTGSVTIDDATPTQGQTLTASNTIADADGLGAISYQWQRDGVDIGGATSATYTTTQADVGVLLRVVVSYTDGQGTPESVASADTAVVTNVNDAPTGSVTVNDTAPTQGQLVTASNTLADVDGLGTITYQWQRGGVDISGATGSTYTTVQADVGGVLRVVASYTDLQGTAESVASADTAAVTNINDAPTGSVTIDDTTLAQGQLLTASNTLTDADGLGSISYQWQRDGVDISGATSATYTTVQTDVGAVLRVIASYTDLEGTAESVASANTTAVTNVNDAPTGSVIIDDTTPAQGQLLTASNTLADADGLGPITYLWQRGGVDISGATSATYTTVQADVGAVLRVIASYTDLQGTAESVASTNTAAVTNVNDAPTGSVTIDDTTPAQGQLLTASNTLADADGLGTITYQWQRGGVDIAGATGSTYTTVQADVGGVLRVVASYTDLQGTAESVAGANTAAVSNVNDAPTGSVSIDDTTPAQGQLLTASNTLADVDGLGTITYQWQRGGVDISGATGSTYTAVQADVGSILLVVASYTDLQGTAESMASTDTATVSNLNDAPAGSVTIDDTTPAQGQLLTASNTLTDVDGLGTITYQWQRDGVGISGATGSTYTTVQADVGSGLRVVASYTDLQGTAESVASADTATVSNLNDTPTGSVTIDETTPTQGQVLTASNTLADADGLGTITYQWQRGGVNISGATGSTYTTVQADVGSVLRVVASYTDLQGTAESVASAGTATVSNVNDAPTGSVTIDDTTPAQGQMLTASNTLADMDGLGTITYQWQRGGADISGATGSTYTTVQADVGSVLRVVASYTDLQGTAESVASADTAVVTNINDAPTGSVTVDDTTPTQGQLLTASNTLADADGLGTISYQWQRGGVDISGATGSTYTTVQADVGSVLRVVASYTDLQGTAENVASADTAAVSNVNDTPTGSVSIDDTTPTQGQVLTASNTLADVDGLGPITYQWQRAGLDISGATGSTYTAVQADVGSVLRVVASYTDLQGTTESVASADTANVSNVNDSPTGSVTIDDTTPAQGQVLTASNTLADADGLGTITYQWQRDGVGISGATGSTYTTVQADVGSVLRVVATYTDLQGTAESVASADTATVSNLNDAPTGSVTIDDTTPAQGQLLTASNTLADADGLGSISYQWQRDGVDISGATSSTYTTVQTDMGSVLRVVASYTDLQGTAESVASAITTAVTNVNDAPTGSVIIDDTTPAQGQLLTASNTLADADGLGTITFQWQRGGVNIPGATGSNYTTVQADVGSVLRVVASYTDLQGTAESVASAGTAAVTNINDTPTGSVMIDDTTPTQGQLLTASNTLADVDGLGSITYQWQRAGLDISGATGSTYTTVQADVGSVLRVVASYTDLQGTAENVASDNAAAVSNVNDAPTGSVSIYDVTPDQGQLLTASNTLADVDGLGTITYQWQRGELDISGATGSTYTTVQADVGSVLRVVASYTDLQGTAESVASAETAAVSNVNDAPTGAPLIVGSPVEDQTLNVDTSTLADADGMGALTFQWLRDGQAIPGATGASYLLGDADVGTSVQVRTAFVDSHGTQEMLTSAAAGPIANLNDLPDGQPEIQGETRVAQQLTASMLGISDADGWGPFTYQWRADSVDIVGATTDTLSLGPDLVGKLVSLRVSYVDGHGTPEVMTSAAVGPVATPAPAPDPDTDTAVSVPPAVAEELPQRTGNTTSTTTMESESPIESQPQAAPAGLAATAPASTTTPAASPTTASNAGAESLGPTVVFATPLEPKTQDPGTAPQQVAVALRREESAALAVIPEIELVLGKLSPLTLTTEVRSIRVEEFSVRPTEQEATRREVEEIDLATRSWQIGGLAFTALAAAWATRVSGIMASLMVSVPIWRNIDPLPILHQNARNRRDWLEDLPEEPDFHSRFEAQELDATTEGNKA